MSKVKTFNDKKVKKRLVELRKSKNLSQSELGLELNEMLNTKMQKDANLDGENGKQTVSQLERTRNLTIDFAFAYANIFNVSLDYILGWSDDFKPENKSIKEYTGLSDDAIKTLKELNTKSFDKVRNEYDIKINFRHNKSFYVSRELLG